MTTLTIESIKLNKVEFSNLEVNYTDNGKVVYFKNNNPYYYYNIEVKTNNGTTTKDIYNQNVNVCEYQTLIDEPTEQNRVACRFLDDVLGSEFDNALEINFK